MQALSLGNKLEHDKKKLASNLQNKPQTWLVRGLVSVYSSYGYDITYTRSVLYWTCISLKSVIQNQLLVRTPFGGNNFGQDTQINMTAVSKLHVLTIIKQLHKSSS